MRLPAGVLLLGTVSTSLALPKLKPFTGAITGWLDPFGQLPLPKWGNHDATTEDKSVFDIISNDDKFTKITKAIKFAEGIEDILKDSESSVTFFAVPDSALKPPHRDGDHPPPPPRDGDHPPHPPRDGDYPPPPPPPRDLQAFETIGSLEDALQALEHVEGDHDDDDKERKKKILKKIVTGLLKYHILPEKLTGVDLGKNHTYGTSLVLPESFDERALRIRVSPSFKILPPPPGGLTINWYSQVVHQDKAASNGVIHTINRPLFPPPAVFQELFFVPSLFSTLTSAIQRTGLTDAIDLGWKKGKDGSKGHLHGSKAATIFAPTNRAFEHLPPKLKLFLFSPFGTHVLGKLLQYHIVPDYIFHTDYAFNATASESFHLEADLEDMPVALGGYFEGLDHPHGPKRRGKHFPKGPHGPDHEPISSHHVILPTALANHTIHAQVEKVFIGPRIPHHPRRIATILKANHHFVPFPDSVGFNGAVHVIDKILDPRGHGHHDHPHHGEDTENSWKGWEDWLVKWADEA